MYYEKLTVPVPEENTRVFPDGKVKFKMWGSGKSTYWVMLGKLLTDADGNALQDRDGNRLMVPHDNYRKYFSYRYNNYVIEKDPDNIPMFFGESVAIGPYALLLGLATQSGLYPLLVDVFGAETANALMDLALLYNFNSSLRLNNPSCNDNKLLM